MGREGGIYFLDGTGWRLRTGNKNLTRRDGREILITLTGRGGNISAGKYFFDGKGWEKRMGF